jgi:hypothetical protein
MQNAKRNMNSEGGKPSPVSKTSPPRPPGSPLSRGPNGEGEKVSCIIPSPIRDDSLVGWLAVSSQCEPRRGSIVNRSKHHPVSWINFTIAI